MAEKYDPKGRQLYTGETYDEKTGRYRYTYVDKVTRKRNSVYSYTLIASDRVPTGRRQREGESLREKKKRILEGTYHKRSDTTSEKDDDSPTLYELMYERCKERYPKVSENTKKGYITQLNFMSNHPELGNRRLNSFKTVEDGIKFFEELHQKFGRNNSTLHTLRGILRPAIKARMSKGEVIFNAFDFEIKDDEYGGVKNRDALSPKDIKRYMDFLRTDPHFKKYFDGVLILLSTGLRISEFCGITEKDIDFENHYLTVKRQLLRFPTSDYDAYYYIQKPKTKNGARVVPLTPDAEQAFRNVIANRPKDANEEIVWNLDKNECATKFLWIDKDGYYEVAQHWQNHVRWSVAKYNRIYKDELPKISCHVFRHTFCTMMARHLLPQELQALMGHGDSKTTMKIYTHLRNEEIADKCYQKFETGAISFYDMKAPIGVTAPANDYSGEESEPDFSEPVDEVDDE